MRSYLSYGFYEFFPTRAWELLVSKSLYSLLIGTIFLIVSSCSSVGFQLRAPAGAQSLEASSCFLIVEKLFGSARIRDFKKKNYHFTKITSSSNRRFIQSVTGDLEHENLFYFHVESQYLKYLNDKIFKDKQITYGFTVLYQNIFYDKILKDPYLSEVMAIKYADYKGLRIAFNSGSIFEEKKILELLQEVYNQTAIKFEKELKKYPFEAYLSDAPEQIKNIRKWFVAGSGRSADRAAAASRIARKLPNENIPHFQNNKAALKSLLAKVDSLHNQIIDSFLNQNSSGFLERSAIDESNYVLSQELIDLIRKINVNAPDHFTSFNRSVQQYFGVNITQDEFKLLTDYLNAVDTFSPPIFQEETLPLNLSLAKKGLISADISQKGAEGQYQNMSRLIGISNPSTAIERVREGYWVVDKSIKNARDWFLTAINYTGPPDNIKQVYHSGDDILFFPDSEVTRFEKSEILKKLANHQNPSEFRIVFLPPRYSDSGINIAENLKSKLIVEAENIEKSIRRLVKAELSLAQSKELGIAINIRPTTKAMSFEIMVSSSNLIPRKKLRAILNQIKVSEEIPHKFKFTFIKPNS